MTTELLMSHLDLNNTGRITENQFVGAIRRKYSDKSLNDMLRFDLIPLEVLDEANMQPSLSGSMVNLNNDRVNSIFNLKSNYIKRISEALLAYLLARKFEYGNRID